MSRKILEEADIFFTSGRRIRHILRNLFIYNWLCPKAGHKTNVATEDTEEKDDRKKAQKTQNEFANLVLFRGYVFCVPVKRTPDLRHSWFHRDLQIFIRVKSASISVNPRFQIRVRSCSFVVSKNNR
jgi:hypothetical protein